MRDGTGATHFAYNDHLAFLSDGGGTERMRIDNSGNVGIGTSSPSFASGAFNGLEISYSTIPTLRLTDTSNTSFDIFKNGLNVILVNRDAGYLRFDTSNSDRMLIDASGNVGIGTSSPTFVTGDGLHVQRTGSATVRVERTGSTASAGEFFAGNDQVVIQSLTATAPLAFRTGGNPATERMRIDSSGNVGIGTTSPYNPGGYDRVLDIRGANGSQIVIGGTASNPTSTALQVDASNGNFLLSNNKGGGSLVFRTSVSDDDRTERMRIDSSGNVGIGTTSPSSYGKFVVRGSGNIVNFDATSGPVYVAFKENTTNRFFLATPNGSDGLLFVDADGSSERMRIDSSGNLLVGRTSVGTTSTGHSIRGADSAVFARAGGEAIIAARNTDDGQIIRFDKDGTTVGSIASGPFRIFAAGVNNTGWSFGDNSAVLPMKNSALADNFVDLGSASYRLDDIYATNPTIQTSDRNEKQDIDVMSEAETRVAVACKGLIRKFRWIDAVAEKGDDARIHFGIIAQDLQDAFTAEGLDAGRYAMFISSTWTDEETGEERTRMGVRYPELLAFIIAAI
jgi:hypothetical protein